MLNKQICLKCKKAKDFRKSLKGTTHKFTWRSWHNGFVCCPLEYEEWSKEKLLADATPPEWCPNKLEHAVAESMNA